jgi:alanine-synthesizing transaminase
MRWSTRLPQKLAENSLQAARTRLLAAGKPLTDLTLSNPTRCGLVFDEQAVADALANVDCRRYEPDARGLKTARLALEAHFGPGLAADRTLLTASTSEAYSLLFKLLCDPGDAVLVPQPSYPLFDYLTRLEGVRALPYGLSYVAGCWQIDWLQLKETVAASAATIRAVLVVNPNNPTGHALAPEDHDALERTLGARVALISDEVFFQYGAELGQPVAYSAADGGNGLRFVLGGLSKACGLPQLKLSWVTAHGPQTLVSEALERLEHIADAYLSAATPVQLALERLLAAGAVRCRLIHERLLEGRRCLAEMLRRCHPSCSLLTADGGWTAVLRLPETIAEDELVLQMLQQHGVLVHPGYFFDFPRAPRLVVSLLVEPQTLCDGLERSLPRF